MSLQIVGRVLTAATGIAALVALSRAPTDSVIRTAGALVGIALLAWATWWALSHFPARRRLQALTDRIEVAEIERARYERAARTLVDRAVKRPLRERLKVVHFIGETPEQDSCLYKWVTAALEPDKPIVWHYIQAAANGAGVPGKESFRQLEDVEAWEAVGGLEWHRLQPLAVGAWSERLWALVFFNPEIVVGSPRNWRLQYRWAGEWNNFRASREGECWVSLREDGDEVQWDLLEMEIVLPRGAQAPQLAPSEAMPAPDIDIDELGRRHFTYRVESPRPLVYRWHIAVDSLDDHGSPIARPKKQVVPRLPPGQGRLPYQELRDVDSRQDGTLSDR